MKSSILSVIKYAVLSAAFLLGTLAPSYASDNHACNARIIPIGAGLGVGGSSPDALGQAPSVALAFYLVQLPDGSVDGKAVLSYKAYSYTFTDPTGTSQPASGVASSVEVKLKSYTFKDGALMAEGLITSLTGQPHFGPAFLFPPDGNHVGDTIFFQVYDLGDGFHHHSDAFIEGALPAWFGSPDASTVIAILAANLGGDGVAPAAECRQVVFGDFDIND